MKFGNLIRTGSTEILSCTLTNFQADQGQMEFLDINFRKAVEKECGIIFYKYEGKYYYPICMEFRLIDNNVLFLLRELKISHFSHLALLLASSFKREEEREVDFFALVYEVNELPRFSVEIPELVFDSNDKVIEVKANG